MKKSIFYFLLLAVFPGCQNQEKDMMHLKVSSNSRYLEYSSGEPFLYLGDTAWELFHRLNREEAVEYLENRAEKGFTVIQAVILAELDGLRIPNAYGEVPLIDLDPAKPNEKYFEHVDFIVSKAEELGLIVGMLPTWGDKVPNDIGGTGPVVFNPENARIFGEFLGRRYKDKPIIWILGGDRNVDNETAYQIWKNMAAGLKAGDGGRHLITFHPRGAKSSSVSFHNEEWLDFNMYQSGHSHKFTKVYEYAVNDYLLQPVKPFVEGEPAYEDIPVEFWKYCDWDNPLRIPTAYLDENYLIKDTGVFKQGYFTDYDVRIHGYWNLLSGACGYTYGNNAVWQMFKKGGSMAVPCLFDWRESLDRPGADNIRHMRKIFETRSFSKLVPDQSIVYGDNPKDDNHIRSAAADDGSFLLAYMAQGQPVAIVMKKIAGSMVKAWWFDPRNGEVIGIGGFDNRGFQTFTPPSSGVGNDWLLVLDNADVFRKPL